jgi:hypothetical protein
MKKIIYFLFFLNSYLYSAEYAIFVPKATQEKFTLFIEKINQLGFKRECYYFYARKNFDIRDFDCFIEGGGSKNGRRALFESIQKYKQVFVFENENKFCSYYAYKNYASTIKPYLSAARIYQYELENAKEWPKIYRISSEPDLETLERQMAKVQRVLKEINVEFVFLNLRPKIAVFIPNNFVLQPYKEIYTKIFYKKEFETDNEVLSELREWLFIKLKDLIKYDLDDFDPYFYQEGCGDFAGRRKLFYDMKTQPYRFKIFSFEDKQMFKKKIPKSFLNSFDLEFCEYD